MAHFVHLHAHTSYSLAEGAIKVGRLATLCADAGMPAIAVTDTNNLFGALEVSETMSGAGIQPIAGLQQAVQIEALSGLEARWVRPPSLVLLAQSKTGFENLMALTSDAFLRSVSDDGPCASLAWIEKYSDGVICLSGGWEGPVDRLLRADREDDAEALVVQLEKVFPGRFYVELQRHGDRDWAQTEMRLLDWAYRDGLPIVATNEPYFPTADDFEAHDALLCIADGAYVHQDDRRTVTADHYFKSADEMAKVFADLPEAVSTTLEVARRCAFRPRTHNPILPNFTEVGGEGDISGESGMPEALNDTDHVAPSGMSEAEMLAREAEEGLRVRLASIELAVDEKSYWDRLAFELDIINRMGFPGYFLIVSDFIKWAKQHDIPVGPGRGSGAGSLVAWSLTITDLDPLRFGLLFERFLNPERVSMPDFDVDFCQDRRDEVIRYVQEKYGRDRVAQIITFGKLQARAVLRDVGRVLGMPFGQVDRLCKLVPNNPANPVTLAEAIELEPRLKEERDREEAVAALLSMALKLEGLYRHASTHAAGVVIGDRPLHELTPLYLDPRADMPATQYNMKWVEPAGLVKFDFLGLKTLTVIARAAAYLLEGGRAVDIEQIPLDDRPTFDMLGEGAAVGVFQLESAGMRSTLKGMKPDTLEDIIALISLYRPGPMENIPTYIERKQGLSAPDYLHDTLEPVLKETYGVIIYQEQVMQIAQILSGYSLGEADLLRRAMGKKKKEEMDKQRVRFVDGAKERGVDAGKASSIFDLVQKFAGYGFNKSHAAAYALIAYQTAYLKANHPAEFLAASMSLDRTNTDKLAVFVKEARTTGIELVAPHVNQSRVDFSVREGRIVYALAAVKNVGEAAVGEIVAERERNGPYKDMFDLAERIDLRVVGKRSIESLARAGAFDGISRSRAEALANADLLVKYSAQFASEQASEQGGLFDTGTATLDRPRLQNIDAAPSIDQLNDECQAVGFYFSGHPLEDYERELIRLNAMDHASLMAAARQERTSAPVAVVVKSARVRRSKAGKPFAWVECSDATGEFEVTVFSEVLGQAREMFEAGALLLLNVVAEERDGEVRLTCEGVRSLDSAASQTSSQLRLTVVSPNALGAIKRRLAAVKPPGPDNAGDVVISYESAGELVRSVDVVLGEKAACTPAVRSALKSIEGVVAVELV
ncbi:MAG: DNA polymerase III subunit alpha [Pseudomonadota bacterium]